jgi:PKD repeat protein
MQYLYGTAAAGAAPAATFAFSPASPTAGTPVAFTDGTSNSPTGWQWEFGDPASGSANQSQERNPSHTFAAAGTYPVTLYAGSLNGTGVATKSVVVAPSGASGACVPSDTTLCLNSGRFEVTATFTRPGSPAAPAHAHPLTSDAGYFWFFDPKNVEIVVKVLNACTQPAPRYWVFAAGLTSVQVTMTVRDTQRGGNPNQYGNPQNTPFQPIQDTNAFATCP